MASNGRFRTGTIVAEGALGPPNGANAPHAMTEDHMGMGRGILLWLLGIPLPIIILLALFWR
jgi:hypothetical protein